VPRSIPRHDPSTALAKRSIIVDRTRCIRALLHEHGATGLAERPVLDVGCGAGDSLAGFVAATGAQRVVGVDLSLDRAAVAARRVRPGAFVVGDARRLPFRDAAFGVCSLSTVFSSVREDDDRAALAGEVRRVLQPGGGVLIYDFPFHPLNPSVRGAPRAALRALFPGWRVASCRVTPVPHLVRTVARLRPASLPWLYRQPVPRTHYLAWITTR